MIKKAKLSQKNKLLNIKKIRNSIDKIDTQILKYLSLRRKEVMKITKYKKRSEIVDQRDTTLKDTKNYPINPLLET